MRENRCIMCGDPIPEGRQVCPLCEARAEEVSQRGKDPGDGAGEVLPDDVAGELDVRLGRSQ